MTEPTPTPRETKAMLPAWLRGQRWFALLVYHLFLMTLVFAASVVTIPPGKEWGFPVFVFAQWWGVLMVGRLGPRLTFTPRQALVHLVLQTLVCAAEYAVMIALFGIPFAWPAATSSLVLVVLLLVLLAVMALLVMNPPRRTALLGNLYLTSLYGVSILLFQVQTVLWNKSDFVIDCMLFFWMTSSIIQMREPYLEWAKIEKTRRGLVAFLLLQLVAGAGLILAMSWATGAEGRVQIARLVLFAVNYLFAWIMALPISRIFPDPLSFPDPYARPANSDPAPAKEG